MLPVMPAASTTVSPPSPNAHVILHHRSLALPPTEEKSHKRHATPRHDPIIPITAGNGSRTSTPTARGPLPVAQAPPPDGAARPPRTLLKVDEKKGSISSLSLSSSTPVKNKKQKGAQHHVPHMRQLVIGGCRCWRFRTGGLMSSGILWRSAMCNCFTRPLEQKAIHTCVWCPHACWHRV